MTNHHIDYSAYGRFCGAQEGPMDTDSFDWFVFKTIESGVYFAMKDNTPEALRKTADRFEEIGRFMIEAGQASALLRLTHQSVRLRVMADRMQNR